MIPYYIPPHTYMYISSFERLAVKYDLYIFKVYLISLSHPDFQIDKSQNRNNTWAHK